MGEKVKKEVIYSAKNTLPVTTNPALMSISHKLSVRDGACLAFQRGRFHQKQRLTSICSTSGPPRGSNILTQLILWNPVGLSSLEEAETRWLVVDQAGKMKWMLVSLAVFYAVTGDRVSQRTQCFKNQ